MSPLSRRSLLAVAAGFAVGGLAGCGPGSKLGTVVFATTGSSFAPVVELVPGSSATVTWQDDSGATVTTGLTPNISWGSATPRTVRMHCTNYAEVRSINLGFDSAQDSGREGPGSDYNKIGEQVTRVSELGVLTELVQFMAANTPLTETLDLTGLSKLKYVECYAARLTGIALTGCTSLTRLCLENNQLTYLDLNPVAGSLRDLRSAVQDPLVPGTPLHFETLTSPMTRLWHYCIRDHPATNIVPHARLPVIEQHWAWNTGQTTSDSPTSPVLTDYNGHGNSFDQASVDRILSAINTSATGSGGIDLSGSAAPSGAGATAKTALIARGWNVTTS